MNIKEFQKKLMEVVLKAQGAGNELSQEEVEQFFAGEGLDKAQLDKVYEYLLARKIAVTGLTMAEPKTEEKEVIQEADPLNAEEEAYLKHYQDTLKELPHMEEPMETLYEQCIQGDENARQRVIEHFMPTTVDLALSMHRKEIPLADMISEGNVHLVMAIQRLTTPDQAENQIQKGIQDGIQYMIDTQIEQKRQDETMVEKVRRLETAIKDLTDDDDKMEFSVDELAIFLDMSKEEIEDVLRLAGEDK